MPKALNKIPKALNIKPKADFIFVACPLWATVIIVWIILWGNTN